MPPRNLDALIIFVKAPVPGGVKTRLSPPLTPTQAVGLYRAFVKDTFHMAMSVRSVDVFIAYDPHAPHLRPAWVHPRAAWFKQKGRNLGERLRHAFARQLRIFKRVIIIGSDSPELPARLIQKAFQYLHRNEVVVGPSVDGGYFLIGLSRLHKGLFKKIPWSTSHVFSKTRAILRKYQIPYGQIPTHPDIDTFEDLLALRRRLKKKSPGCLKMTRAELKKMKFKEFP